MLKSPQLAQKMVKKDCNQKCGCMSLVIGDFSEDELFGSSTPALNLAVSIPCSSSLSGVEVLLL